MPRLQYSGTSAMSDGADFFGGAIGVEASGPVIADEDHVERRARIVLLMLRVLGIELHADECGFCSSSPGTAASSCWRLLV